MDKFGIFNLLGSLLNKNSQENTPSAPIFTTNDTLKPERNTKNLTPPLPLQSSMINTMTNHDEFIKRVKQKNKN